jgi:hypothetical protein
MFSLTFWSTSKTVVTTSEAPDDLPSDAPADPPLSPSELPLPEQPHSTTEADSNAVPQRDNSVQPTEETSSTTPSSDPQQSTAATSTKPTTLEVPEPRSRKTSIRSSLSLLRRSTDHHQHKPMLDAAHVQQKKHGVVYDLKRAIRSRSGSRSRSEKRAKESAEIVRALIIGPNSISPASKKPQALSKVQLDKVKSELAKAQGCQQSDLPASKLRPRYRCICVPPIAVTPQPVNPPAQASAAAQSMLCAWTRPMRTSRSSTSPN